MTGSVQKCYTLRRKEVECDRDLQVDQGSQLDGSEMRTSSLKRHNYNEKQRGEAPSNFNTGRRT